jgi:hypothetical protein
MIKLIGSLAKIMHYYFAMPLLTVATWLQIVGILLIIIRRNGQNSWYFLDVYSKWTK